MAGADDAANPSPDRMGEKKKEEKKRKKGTFFRGENGEERLFGRRVPEAHRAIGRAGQQLQLVTVQAQAPHGVRVARQRAAQHARVCSRTRPRTKRNTRHWVVLMESNTRRNRELNQRNRTKSSSTENELEKPNKKWVQSNQRRTVGVVGIDVGSGYVPALERAVQGAAETLFPAGTHGQTQHRARVASERVHRLHVKRGRLFPSHPTTKTKQSINQGSSNHPRVNKLTLQYIKEILLKMDSRLS